ncbi:MAG: Crp/Fnr family transcriptional regulator [Gammaproteobacteria bacterium]|nr:Crp/Fnr family transcriptional regulator [Gammaproteobacteria bacterium]
MASLSPAHQQSVIDFASFLSAQNSTEPAVEFPLDPELIERPGEETVVGAIKRLKKTYYMLDTDVLLNQASSLMGQHLLHGREARLVIDELEALFEASYQEYRQQ